jgi:large repetitive protein
MKRVVLLLNTIIAFVSHTTIFAQSPLQVSVGKDLTACYGGYVKLNAYVAGGVPPYTYKWTPNDELSASNAASVILIPTFTTTYRLSVTDAKGAVARDEIKVEVFQRPTIHTLGFVSVEPNEKIKLETSVAGGNGALTYTWKPSAGLDNPSAKSPVAKPSKSTTYSVLVKDSKGCVATEQVTVTINYGSSVQGQ